VLNELRKLRRNKKPFFLWVHYLDPHHPYHQHPGDLFGKRKIDGYDEEIHYTDKEMGPLLESLSTGKRQPWVAITADHGENFGEHGTSPHARTLYRQVTHVPLIIRGPRLEGRQIEAPVASGDINPTFLELASIARPKDITMVSQASTVLGERVDEGRLVFQENSYARPRRDAKAIVGPRYHLIWDSTNDTYELFDLLKDPDEKKNLAGRGIPREAELRRILKNFAQSTHVPDNLAK
jgi:arylsulfatase A-like enzyme